MIAAVNDCHDQENLIAGDQATVPEGTVAFLLMTGQAVSDKVTDAVKKSGLKLGLFYTGLSEEQEIK